MIYVLFGQLATKPTNLTLLEKKNIFQTSYSTRLTIFYIKQSSKVYQTRWHSNRFINRSLSRVFSVFNKKFRSIPSSSVNSIVLKFIQYVLRITDLIQSFKSTYKTNNSQLIWKLLI